MDMATKAFSANRIFIPILKTCHEWTSAGLTVRVSEDEIGRQW